MGFVDINPDADIGGYPLLSGVSGAVVRWFALADSSDTTYVYQETANSVDGVDIIGFANPSIPAGAVVTGAEIHGRCAHVYPNTVAAFVMQANPKPAYVSPFGPDPFAACETSLTRDVGRWYFATAADGAAHDFVVSYDPSFQYNNGQWAWEQLNWNQVDLNSLRVNYAWHTPANGTNRLYKLFLRIFYDTPPTVSGVQPTDLSGGQTFTTTPTITWTYADTEGEVQTQYRVIVVSSTAIDSSGRTAGTAGFDPTTVTTKAFDSGNVAGSTNRSTITPVGLTNLANYYAYVKVWHTPIQGIEMASGWTASSSFQVNGTPPSTPTINVAVNDTLSRIEVEVIQGSWSSTPYPNYFNIDRNLPDFSDWEHLRNGVNVSTMTGLRTGSTAANNIQTPNVTALQITGDIEIKVCVAYEGTAGANDYIICKADTPNGTSWNLRLMSSNKPQFEYTNAGLRTALAPNAIPMPTAKTPFWIKAKHVTASNWHTDFWYSLDPPETNPLLVQWQSLGSFTGSGSGTITSTAAPLSINGTPTINQSLFRIYYAEVRNSSDVIVANPDFRGAPLGSTTITDSTGKVWTIARTGANQNLPFVRRYDYEVGQGVAKFYRAQAVTLASGVPVASAYATAVSGGLSVSGVPYVWWFKVVLDPTLNHTFQMISGSWDSTRPAETASFTPLGRRNKIVVSDGVRGHQQTLSVECTTTADYNALVAIYEAQQVVLVQTYQNERYFCFTGWKDKMGTIATGYFVVDLEAVEVDRPAIS